MLCNALCGMMSAVVGEGPVIGEEGLWWPYQRLYEGSDSVSVARSKNRPESL